MAEETATHVWNLHAAPHQRAVWTNLLTEAGHRVTEPTAVEGLPPGTSRPDLILLDAQLNGHSTCAALKADPLTAGIPILCLMDRTATAADRANWLDAGADALLPGDAEPVELLATVRALLRQSGRSIAALRHLAGDLDEVIWLVDPRHQRVLYVNAAYEKVWGRPAAALYCDAADWLHAVHPDDRPRVEEALRQRPTSGQFNEEYRVVAGDGTIRWIWDRVFPIRDAAGQACLALGFAEDVTERKQLEDQYRRAQKMELVGRLAGGITHDFNNLLTIIQGYGEILLSDVPAGHPGRQYVEHIHYAVQRATALTQQLLAVSRQQEVPPVPLDLNGLAADIARLLRPMMGPTIRVELLLDPDLPAALGVAGHIEQVLINLFSNARDAMSRGGTLTVATKQIELGTVHAGLQPGHYVVLTVADTGCGMDEATRARLFEPFFTTKTRSQRTGLGLFMATTLLQQSRGAISVDSVLGQGSTFYVYLPCLAGPVPAASAGPGQDAECGTETVLLVQPDREMRELVRRLLEMKGYCVLPAQHGAEAARMSRQHSGPVHLLLTEDGAASRDLANRLRRLRSELRVLFLVDGAAEASVSEPRLRKPFSPTSLARRVREVLDQV